MIVVEHLTKRYAARPVVQDVTFHVKKGEIVGFLGPNGAGKSTTMKMLTGYLTPSAGKVTIGNFEMAADPIKAKSLMGYMPENPPLYPEMSVRDYLTFIARLRGVDGMKVRQAVDDAITKCWLTEVPKKLIGHLSKGFQQRVGLAQALIHNPPVLILDEPTNGLDPKQIIQIRELIKGFANDHTVILSTHILPEVQNTCQRVLIINGGKIVAEGAPEALESQLRGGSRIHAEVRGPLKAVEDRLSSLNGVRRFEVKPRQDAGEVVSVTVETGSEIDLRERIASEVVGAGWGLVELRSVGLSLEEIFLKLTTTDSAAQPAAPQPTEAIVHG
jgi:ABC-2 type transport system ATP-binding protein